MSRPSRRVRGERVALRNGQRSLPLQTLDRAPQLMGVHAGVALRGVQVLVPEQLLNLAQIRARTAACGSVRRGWSGLRRSPRGDCEFHIRDR